MIKLAYHIINSRNSDTSLEYSNPSGNFILTKVYGAINLSTSNSVITDMINFIFAWDSAVITTFGCNMIDHYRITSAKFQTFFGLVKAFTTLPSFCTIDFTNTYLKVNGVSFDTDLTDLLNDCLLRLQSIAKIINNNSSHSTAFTQYQALTPPPQLYSSEFMVTTNFDVLNDLLYRMNIITDQTGDLTNDISYMNSVMSNLSSSVNTNSDRLTDLETQIGNVTSAAGTLINNTFMSDIVPKISGFVLLYSLTYLVSKNHILSGLVGGIGLWVL